jgi:phosphoribosylamine--glycine ligase
MRGDRLVTNGGRILNVTGLGEDIGGARTGAYAGVDRISFAGMRYRTDIAANAETRVG